MNDTQLPYWFGKSALNRIIKAYEILWHDTYGTRYFANFGMIGKIYKPLLEQFTEWQIAALFVMHFNWYGGTGDNNAIHHNLEGNMYPIQWVPLRMNEYITFLTNAERVDFNNNEAVKTWVKDQLRDAHRLAIKAGVVVYEKREANRDDS